MTLAPEHNCRITDLTRMGWGMFDKRLVAALRDDWLIYTAAFLYFCVMGPMLAAKGVSLFRPNGFVANIALMVAGLVAFLLVAYLVALLRLRPDSPLRMARSLADDWRLGERAVAGLPICIALAAFLMAFSAVKSAIPLFGAYRFDSLFIELDLAIHGRHAWQLLHPLLGHPFVTFLLGIGYHLWILLLYVGAPLVCIWIERPDLRRQFVLAYILCWSVLGTALAIAFASVGPCFLEAFSGRTTFHPLMEYLADADRHYPIWTLDVQQQLLDWHRQHSHDLGRGISAMPSMHVSVACLFAIMGWHHSRGAGIAATIFLIVILIGSVHLGYHYAVDGYASVVLSLLLWWVAGWLLRSPSARRARAAAPATQ